jgi:predicted O-methyltransferase YrrM
MFDAKRYERRHDWTTLSELRQHIHRFFPTTDPVLQFRMLEIGSYEGLTACFLSDEFLDHPDSTLTCVDPYDLNDSTTEVLSDTEHRFYTNIERSKNGKKIQHIKKSSKDFFHQLASTTPFLQYDFIYIDGSHLPEDVYHDITHAFPYLKPGGILWMDDYRFGTDGSVKRAMDAALASLPPNAYTRIHENYQLAIQKIKGI